jgi:hypothetical protein
MVQTGRSPTIIARICSLHADSCRRVLSPRRVQPGWGARLDRFAGNQEPRARALRRNIVALLAGGRRRCGLWRRRCRRQREQRGGRRTLCARLAWARDLVSILRLPPPSRRRPAQLHRQRRDTGERFRAGLRRRRASPRQRRHADGEFARGSQTYAGTGTLRVSW